MKLSELFLPEWDEEMAATRKVLERVPDDRYDWKPHPKSMELGYLALLLAGIPDWCANALELDSFDLGGGGAPRTFPKRAELLQAFDKNAARGRAAVARMDDIDLSKPWSLKMGDRTLMTRPKGSMWRNTLNHLVHHRAQMGVYLRLNNIPVPSMYGPTADEKSF